MNEYSLNKMIEVIKLMLATQDRLNMTVSGCDGQAVGFEWVIQDWDYSLGAGLEVAEAINHDNWSWRKNTTYNQPLSDEQLLNIQVELADVMHFALSITLIDLAECVALVEQSRAIAATEIATAFRDAAQSRNSDDSMGLRRALRTLCGMYMLEKNDWKGLAASVVQSGMDFSHFAALFFGKVELKSFRWSNGYKEKTYRKLWRSVDDPDRLVEDNVHLFEIVKYLMSTKSKEAVLDELLSGKFRLLVSAALEQRYCEYA